MGKLVGLSDRQAAKVAGCTHRAIGVAKKSGHLQQLSDGSVSEAAVQEWLTNRRAARGGYKKEVSTQVSTPAPAKILDRPAPRVILPQDIDDEALAAEASNVIGDLFGTRAQAELARDSYMAHIRRLQYDREIGKVVEVDRVAAVVGDALARVRTRLLAIPAERSPQLHRLKSVTELQAALLQAINEALNELATEAVDALLTLQAKDA